MAKQIVLLSGHVCAGKSTLANNLAQRCGFQHIKTWNFVKARGANLTLERTALQKFGEELDKKTGGAWLRDDLQKIERDADRNALIIVDSVRHPGQIEHIRKSYGRSVVHVHLTADRRELESRYNARRKKKTDIAELKSYKEVLANQTEANVEALQATADIVISSDRCTEEDIVIRVASHLGWYGKEYLRLVDVLIGGQYGSEGKGHVASHLGSEYDLLIRVGGPNAGHKVKIPGTDKVFTFRHLPSGSLASQGQLLIGPGAVLNVQILLEEIAKAGVGVDRLMIDPQAMTISAEDIKREKKIKGLIGSTGQGVGQATARRIVGRAEKHVKLAKDIKELKPYLKESCGVLQRYFREKKRIFLEGTQGTGLSMFHGHYPHVTSRDTTVAGCLAEAGISPTHVRKVIMVCRSYPIRVASPGGEFHSGFMAGPPLSWAEIEKRAGFPRGKLEGTETGSVSGRLRRVGEFDWALLRKAATLNAPTDIALTFADYIDRKNADARRFEQLTQPTIRFIQELEAVASAPVTLISTEFHDRSIIDRRAW